MVVNNRSSDAIIPMHRSSLDPNLQLSHRHVDVDHQDLSHDDDEDEDYLKLDFIVPSPS